MIRSKFVRSLDSLGRIVLPQNFRSKMRWENGTKISIIRDGDKLILQKDKPSVFLQK